MFTVKIEGLDELMALPDKLSRQVPFAASVAINKTAGQVDDKLKREMSSTFKSPSPYVGRSTFIQRSTKSDLTAIVGLKDQKPSGGTAPAVLLKEHFTGGLRGNKPYEKAIIMMAGMPAGWRAIPGAGIKKDAYGNPNRKEIGEMLSVLRTKMQVWKGRGKKVELTGYFIVPVGAKLHLPPGIYKRIGRGGLALMFLFVKQASYRKVLDLPRTAEEVVRENFDHNFGDAYEDAIRTAR